MNAEAESSIHDALCVVRDLIQEPRIVAGGSAPEMEMSRFFGNTLKRFREENNLQSQVFAEP